MELHEHPDFRPCTGLNILMGAQTLEGCLLGSLWAIDRAWGGERIGLMLQTAEKGKKGSSATLFSPETANVPRKLLPFWLVVGKWNWVFFSFALLCVRGDCAMTQAVWPRLALWGSLAWMCSLVRAFRSQSYECSRLSPLQHPSPQQA